MKSTTPPPPSPLRPPPSDTRHPTSAIRHPSLLALFQKRIEGDDALLRLASLRFREAGLGAECYAESIAELEWLLGFWPNPDRPVVAHLKRELDVFVEADREHIHDFAAAFGGRLRGLVIHDQPELATRPDHYRAALRAIGTRLEAVPNSPPLFVEYATGVEPALFVETLQAVREVERVSGCLDIGHLGLRQVRTAYAARHPGSDPCNLTPQSAELPSVIDDLQDSVESALDLVLAVIEALAVLAKPLHFHLHDGHPLSTASPFGVSDHLSFLDEIPIPFEHHGRCALPPMFGPCGLAAVVAAALRGLGPERVSLSLEIHPVDGLLPLGQANPLFLHWLDKANAERMNHWLSVLQQNHNLLKALCHHARP